MMIKPDAFLAACPSRGLLSRLGEKWSLLVLVLLSGGQKRFGVLRRAIQGVSQKMLTQALRTLERDGLVERIVTSTRPLAVEYALTPLGTGLVPLAIEIKRWAETNLAEIEQANDFYDRAQYVRLRC
jgi:DNA-binding HxlR family transcriptional regulator